MCGCGMWVLGGACVWSPSLRFNLCCVCVLCIQCGQPQCSQCTCACSVSCVFAASAVLCDVGSEGWYSLLPLTQPASELALQLRATPTQGWIWLDVEGLGRLHVLLSWLLLQEHHLGCTVVYINDETGFFFASPSCLPGSGWCVSDDALTPAV